MKIYKGSTLLHDTGAKADLVDGAVPDAQIPDSIARGSDVEATFAPLPDGSVADWSVATRKTGAGSHDFQWTTKEEHVARALGWIIATDPRHNGGLKGDGTTVNSTATMTAVIDAAAATASGSFNSQNSVGGRVFFPAGIYLFNAPITDFYRSGIQYGGAGRTVSRLVNNTTDLIQVNEGQVAIDFYVANLSFETGSSGGHVLRVGNEITLTSALTSGVSYSTLAVTALPAAIASGTTVSTLVVNTVQQNWTTTATVAAGATSIPVTAQNASANFAIGSYVTPPPAAIRTAKFEHCRFLTRNQSSSLIRQRGNAMFLCNTMDTLDLDHQAGSTVPAVDVDTVVGNVHNSNLWTGGWAHGHNTTAAPFFFIKSKAGQHHNNRWSAMTGEQNGGGFIHTYATNGTVIEDCADWDFLVAGGYQADVFKFAEVGSQGTTNARIARSARLTSSGLAAGVSDIKLSATNARNQNITIDSCDPPGALVQVSGGGDVTIVGRGEGFLALNSDTTLTSTSQKLIVMSSATARTITLPDLTTLNVGREFIIKNVGTAACTIATSASQTIDGASTIVLSQYGSVHVFTDGRTATYSSKWFLKDAPYLPRTATVTLAAGAGAGSSPPAPGSGTGGATDSRGTVLWGTGTSTTVGAQVNVTFSRAYPSAPVVTLTPGNITTVPLGLYVASVSDTGFTIACATAPAASQGGTTYSAAYHVTA